MANAIYQDIVVTATWTQLSMLSVGFQGTLTAKNSNVAVIQIRGHTLNTVSGTLDGSKFEFADHRGVPVNLADIEIQGTPGDILKVYGAVDNGWSANAPGTLSVNL